VLQQPLSRPFCPLFHPPFDSQSLRQLRAMRQNAHPAIRRQKVPYEARKIRKVLCQYLLRGLCVKVTELVACASFGRRTPG
jgi:hypothetical protein